MTSLAMGANVSSFINCTITYLFFEALEQMPSYAKFLKDMPLKKK